MAPVLAGFGAGLSFEEQKQLLLLQLQNAKELEKVRQDVRLREAELAHDQARQQVELERYRLDLISKGKLHVADSVSYQLVKAAVLRAYELVPEAYRQRFRSEKKEKRSYTEFVRDLATHFNRWCAASQVKTFEDLQELILLEQFKNTLPGRVVTYINEQKVSKVTDAAKLADEFVLTHRGFFGENRSVQPGSFGG
uniref:SCAN box domain-containing protein n=1 Tax=Sander lucioperca TaxID=283035 RepID=A0A8D0A5Q3_SANLU